MTSPPTRCAIYARLSREDQEKQQSESESIQNQKSLLTRYAAQQGWEVYQIYCDEDYSGADRDRPDFHRMLRAAKEGRFQVLLCKTQSRFTRDMELVEKYIHGLFPLWGIRFVAVADHVDTGIQGGKKARQINGLINEWYLEDLSENIRMVLDNKRREGQYIGSVPLYGYRRDPNDRHRLIPDEQAAPVVRQIFRWALEGHGKHRIAVLLNEQGIPNPTRYKREQGWSCPSSAPNTQGLWSKTTVWRILRNEMYTGVMVQGRSRKVSYKSRSTRSTPPDQWFRVEGTHPPIVDRDTFDRVQQQMDQRTKTDGSGQVHPLSGLVKCMDCGSTMSKYTQTRKNGTRISYLRCSRYTHSSRSPLCTSHSIRLEELTASVSHRIRRHVQRWYDPALVLPILLSPQQEGVEREVQRLSAQLALRNHALRSLYLDKTAGVVDEGQFVQLNQAFLQEQEELTRRLADLERKRAQIPLSVPPAVRLQELLAQEPLPRELIALLVEKIEVGQKDPETGNQSVTILWNF